METNARVIAKPEDGLSFRVVDALGKGAMLPFDVARKQSQDGIDAVGKRVDVLEAKANPTKYTTAQVTLGLLAVGTLAQKFTVAGLKKGDLVIVNPTGALPAGMIIGSALASADNELTITLGTVLAIPAGQKVSFLVLAWRL